MSFQETRFTLNAKMRFSDLQRKYGGLDSDEEFGSKEKEVILWRANFEEFIRCLRHKVDFTSRSLIDLHLCTHSNEN